MRVLRELLLLLVAAAASAALVKRQDSEEAIVYKLFHVDSLVVSRYAVTSITSVVQNSDPEQSKELEFRMQLPETAFISNFSMSVNGRTYYGVAKEKAEAEQEFEERISAGENAGLVQSRSLCSYLHSTSRVCILDSILRYNTANLICTRWNLLQRQIR
jgi:hypothetical protein